MQCLSVAGVLLLVATQALGAPSSKDKPRVLFTCPPEGLCYASPRNCFDNCNAAFSMWSQNGTTTYNITMMSPLSFTAVLIKEQFSEKYDKAIICSFHTPRGIVARVNYPDPIVIQPFVDTTEAEGHTDTLYTQCAVNVTQAAPTKAKFKLISGKWKSELILDEKLAIDVVPAVENARIMSDSEKIEIPSLPIAAVRSHEESNELDEKISEAFAQRRQFEKKAKEVSAATEGKKKVKIVDVEDDKEKSDEKAKVLGTDDSDEESSKSSMKERKVGKTAKKDSRKGRKEKDDDEEDHEKEKTSEKVKKVEDDEEHEEERPRYRDYDEEHEEHEEDPDHAGELCGVLTSLALSLLLSMYHL